MDKLRKAFMPKKSVCPNCGSTNIYLHTKGISGGGYAANYLPDLGAFMSVARFHPLICEDCGLTRFFAGAEAIARLHKSSKWAKLEDM